jgi:hypothetical protein
MHDTGTLCVGHGAPARDLVNRAAAADAQAGAGIEAANLQAGANCHDRSQGFSSFLSSLADGDIPLARVRPNSLEILKIALNSIRGS